jgi:Uma2 family endonuclease
LLNLVLLLKQHARQQKLGGIFGIEVDVILGTRRVPVADAVYLTESQKRRQASLYAKNPNRKSKVRFGRVTIAPALIVEVVSLGHEAHDHVTKFAWYAEAGVANYWILDPFKRSLACFKLGKLGYELDASGKGSSKVRQSLFPSLVIPLAELWET